MRRKACTFKYSAKRLSIFQKCRIIHYFYHGKICPTLILVWWCPTSLIIPNNFLYQQLLAKWTPKSQGPTASHFPNVHRKCYQELKYWVFSYLNPFQAYVAYFEARGSCHSTSTTGNPQRKSSTVRYRRTPAAIQQDDGVVQSEQKISKLDYVLSEPARRYTSQPSLSCLMSLHQAKFIFSFVLAISHKPAGL